MQRLYQIYDLVSRAVDGPIIPHRADGPAVRMFYGTLANKNTQPGQTPADFELLCVGEQSEDGKIVTQVNKKAKYPLVVATGAAWLEDQNRQAAAQLSLVQDGK